MGRSLTALFLCFQFLTIAVAQEPLPAAPPPQTKTEPQKSQPQKPERNDDVDVVKITTNLVQIDAVVTDKKGQKIIDLRPDEVEMLEDGRSQKITNFSYITLNSKPAPTPTPGKQADKNAPPVPPVKLRPEQVRRTIALVVDDLGISFESAYHVRDSLKKFVDQQMQSDDLVAIIRTSGGIGALQQFTSDKRQLYAAIEKVKWIPSGRGNITAFAPMRKEIDIDDIKPSMDTSAKEDGQNAGADLDQLREDYFAVGTLGALNYVVRGLRELPGRKSVVLYSEGFQLFNSKDHNANDRILFALRRLTDLANRASVVIYTLDPRGLPVLGLTAADSTANLTPEQVEAQLNDRRIGLWESQAGLDYLAAQTGGISIKNSNDLNGGMKKIIADQEGYYLIGYRPDDSTFDKLNGRTKFHHISLKVKRAGKYEIRMRNGFFGVSDEGLTPIARTPQEQITNALTSPFGQTGIHLHLTSLFVNDAKSGSAMRSMLHVDARDIDFTQEPDGNHKAVFDILAVAFGDNGQVIEQFSVTHTIRIKEENFAKVLSGGFTYSITVPIKKSGAYQLRTALRDESSSRLGSATQFIEVPDIKKNKLLLSGLLLRGVPLETYVNAARAKTDEQNTNDITADALPTAGPALRQMARGMALVYGFNIYNAEIEKTTGKPNLKIRVRVFRNGELVFTGNELTYDTSDQPDPKRLAAGGGIQLGTAMAPGEYVLQIIVTDYAKEKPRVATQWMDFEIVK
jgi:VWFA-related protein